MTTYIYIIYIPIHFILCEINQLHKLFKMFSYMPDVIINAI